MLETARRGIWKRYLLGALVILTASISATAVAAFHEVDKLVNAFKHNPTLNLNRFLAQADTGKPQTLLLIGSDKRAPTAIDYQGGSARSDTLMLVRLDPSKRATTVMSIPRDLKVHIPGHGVGKINSAYTDGGAQLTLQVVKQVTGLTINHVVTISFGGFRGAVDALGCVFADVDRRYYNETENYAHINIQPGYQKICGSDALDYVRYRHDDNDIIRAARQQDFIRQIKQQVTVAKLIDQRDKLIKIFGQVTQSDIGDTNAVLRLLNLVIASASHPITEIHFDAKLGPSYVTAGPRKIHKLAEEFLGVNPSGQGGGPGGGNPGPPPGRPAGPGGDGLIDASGTGKAEALQVVQQGLRGLQVVYPRRLPPGAQYVGPPRSYAIVNRQNRSFPAFRLVIAKGQIGEYYGIQGTSWSNPPILRSPSNVVQQGGLSYLIFRDASRVRLIAWHTGGGTYWISNTLSESLSEQQMMAIARSTQTL
ncbi:MAG: LCP family protein [Actinobacteria bacterium]|nr:LCP family protein [Actinomycetota bacterium]